MTPSTQDLKVQGMGEILNRIASDVSIVADVPIQLSGVEVTTEDDRPTGDEVVHISFRLTFQEEGRTSQGCLLMPLSDAQVLAGGLMMQPPTRLDEARKSDELAPAAKEAVMELGTFFAGAAESALRDLGHVLVQVQHQGCQGVRADVRPRLDFTDDATFLVGRCKAQLSEYDAQVWVMVLPQLHCLQAEAA